MGSGGASSMTHGARVVRAPHGTEITCKGWQQEAAMRMLMNNLDPDVAERPDDLVVYGGTGKAARNWEAFDAIVRELRDLGDDETLLVQSGKPVGVLRTHRAAPRVLIANSNLVARGATRRHRGAWRNGWCATPRRNDARRRIPRSRSRGIANRQTDRDRVLRSQDQQPRRGAGVAR